MDWRSHYQRFQRTYRRQKYELIVQPVMAEACGCIVQPHVHAVKLNYIYGHQDHYPYYRTYVVEYECADVAKAVDAIAAFHGPGLLDIIMLTKL